jgi:hypothetical protein
MARGAPGYRVAVTADLAQELREHLAEAFPGVVEKGLDYGEVDPVMIDADAYGWALGVSRGARLSPVDRQRLGAAADELERSLSAFPPEAQTDYERLLRIARLALVQ